MVNLQGGVNLCLASISHEVCRHLFFVQFVAISIIILCLSLRIVISLRLLVAAFVVLG